MRQRNGHARGRRHHDAGPGGRPRSAAADQAILDAATELYVELGYDGLTVEGVAARAGVGKTTVYRRYPTKLDLLMAAIACLSDARGPAPDTGNARGDLLALARGYRTMLTGSMAGRAIPVMLAAKARHPDLAAAQEAYVAGRRAEAAGVVRRAVDRGELAAGTDPLLVVDLLVAPLFLRVLLSGDPVDDAYLESLVDAVLRAAS